MNEKKKRSVIGYLTLSVGLIAIGLFILLFIFHVGHLLWVAYLGPLLIILLGLEWIYATYRQSGPR
ncbi:hypothetical protein [Alicyclobacillus dauci]|uniref:Uncharacterized protein n=1 Tax=Alicyclobacillus dauci TaxID=1475485 RepID=A0ABY6YZL8_9BACL|nr:hypothetical protein [Alicyclobacillus dauci]WAH35902.1 hypothetical protein NZD86_16750 [Alicyclobacillus dauci]